MKKQKKLLGVLKLQLSCAEAAAGIRLVEQQFERIGGGGGIHHRGE